MVKEIALSYAERLWNKKDLSIIDDLLSKNIIHHSIFGDFCGRDSVREVTKSWLQAFPDLAFKNKAVVCENTIAVLHWSATSTHLGEFRGRPATRKKISYSGTTLYRIQSGKIVESWAYMDMQNLFELLD